MTKNNLKDVFQNINRDFDSAEERFNKWLAFNKVERILDGDRIIFQKNFGDKVVCVTYDIFKMAPIVEGAEEQYFNNLKTELSNHFKLNKDDEKVNGYKIDLKPYCSGCTEFEANIASTGALFVNNTVVCSTNYVISCTHAVKCKRMYERLKKKG